ncbi:hypothetical protein C7974DRAFT_468641 [Boeremia exigua]|uniref:uncharacterized protein n=1 Tax=Boeremia exigua TaxID=749465 RepID=UPI001E8D5667|nr:uncharacterized protein C7974DRAFT_468641 [Boeremia exigua]KAH6642232.1 hypothetical protein C7974DRAFT_468641 [Boeremia exigua]
MLLAGLTLLGNLIFLVVAVSRDKWRANGLGVLVEAECGKIDNYNKAAHIFINVVSTSNYCMQLLASPTRHDVDKAHMKRQWNSVVIFSPSAYRYHQLTVTEGFVKGKPFDDSQLVLMRDSDEGETAQFPDNLHFVQQELPGYERLSIQECKRKYAQLFIRDRGDVVVVVSLNDQGANDSMVLGASAAGWGSWPYKWLCPKELSQSFGCYSGLFRSDSEWRLAQYDSPKVEYCLSKRMPQRCKLEYGFWITVLTIGSNVCKLLGFIATWVLLKRRTRNPDQADGDNRAKHELLVTTGDAIASFLESPDPESIGMSVVEKRDFEHGIWALRWVSIDPMMWRKRYSCAWFRAIGLGWWLTDTTLLSVIPLVPGIFLLAKMTWLKNDLQLNAAAIKLLGLGNPSGLFLFGGLDPTLIQANEYSPTEKDILRDVALANSPQLMLTIAYYIWNSHLTVMLAAQEYDRYAAPSESKVSAGKKRGLRVSDPIEGTKQRATHFLTIPLKYWVWNTVFQATLHWLASQAIFFARVDVLDHWLEVTKFSISQVGYSILGLLCFFTVSLVGFLAALWTSLRRLENDMPLAATCSGALSAACHPTDPSLQHHKQEVHWGIELAEDMAEEAREDQKEVGRCTFTCLAATYPRAGQLYA